MLKSYLVVSLLALVAIAVCEQDRPIVKTENGLIRGAYRNSRKGRQFAAFEGIPYAKPPIGALRFKEPQPKEPWTGIWDATNVYACIQVNHESQHLGHVSGTEDCLYANVYTPSIINDKPLDVIIHIHGGAFMFGQGNLYGPNNFMDRDIVYVTFNYRLGPLGFLSTEDEVVPGNNGLKDQVQALKWVKENIEQFGGNPESITVTGLSAGGASVHYHLLSPLSKGLFHRAISMSGTSLCNWALVEHPLQKTRQLGATVGCGQQTTKDLVECLKQRSATQIQQAITQFQPWLYNPYSPWGPTVELHGENKFLPDLPYNLLRNGQVTDVPWIMSVTSDEGLYPAADFVYADDRLPYLEKHWSELASYILHYDSTVPRADRAAVAEKIKEYYLKGEPISTETFPALVQALGDRLFVVDAEKTARIQAQVNMSPVYFYYFSYRGGHSISEYYAQRTDNFGVSHADDFMYMASADPTWFASYLQTDADKKMTEMLLDMWTSFASTGKPKMSGIKWKPVSEKPANKLKYLEISAPDKMEMKKADHLGHRPFWDSLPIQENDLIVPEKDEL